MSNNISSYLVGIGGTGSRCLEAALHLVAAGLGPKSLWMGLVDPDAGNGNVDRTKQLAKGYMALQAALRSDGANRLGAGCDLLATQVEIAKPDFEWSPVPRDVRDIRQLFHRNLMTADERALFDALFSPTEEQNMPLEVGFRGRPAVGSAVVAAAARPEVPFWADLLRARERAKSGEQVRIFLVGSIFGGTGAGGLPTIARMLRRHLQDVDVGDTVRIGAALLLPYFVFPDPKDSEQVIAARSAAFLEQARGALRYYHHMLERSGAPVFDELSLVGWPQLIRLDNFAIGNREQSNPPLVPEMLAGLAALRFFREGKRSAPGVSLLGAEENKPFEWSAVPSVDGAANTKRQLGTLLRFAFAMQAIYAPHLQRGKDSSVTGQYWYHRLLRQAQVDLTKDETDAVFRQVRDYCSALLRWAGTMQAQSTTPTLGIKLFGIEKILENALGADGMLLINLGRANFNDIFRDLVSDPEHAQDLAGVFEHLASGNIPKDAAGIGRFVQALYEGCQFQSTRAQPVPA